MTWEDAAQRIYEVLRAQTKMYRKGEEITVDHRGATHVWGMPHVDEAAEGETLVDVHFCLIGVKTDGLDRAKSEIEEALQEYPEPEQLTGGPSYIHLGYHLGSQDLAMMLIAFGEAAGMWKVLIPERLGFSGDEADDLASGGMVYAIPDTQPENAG